jgi:hypothetical protein
MEYKFLTYFELTFNIFFNKLETNCSLKIYNIYNRNNLKKIIKGVLKCSSIGLITNLK